jgi:hypothetical protein
MPFNGSGTFTPKHNWVNEANSGTPILPDRMDDQAADFASGLSEAILRDGTGSITADIPWNNFGITGLRAPALGGDAANKTYVDTATGDRSMGGYKLTNLAVPVAGADGVNLTFLQQYALNVALPSQTGNADKLTTTDGTNASWTNKLKATVIRFKDGADATKLLAFDLTSLTTATTRTVYAPDRDVTLGGFCNMVVLRTTQTWTPPAGITRAEITVVNGGYSSTAHTNSSTGSGNGGAASISIRAVSPSVTYTATVGAGGVGGAAGTDTASVAGGASSFSGTGLTTLTSSNGDLQVTGGAGSPINANDTGFGGASLYAPTHLSGNGVGIGQGASAAAPNAAAYTGAAGGIIIRY